MKKALTIKTFLLVLLFSSISFAQFDADRSSIALGVGYGGGGLDGMLFLLQQSSTFLNSTTRSKVEYLPLMLPHRKVIISIHPAVNGLTQIS